MRVPGEAGAGAGRGEGTVSTEVGGERKDRDLGAERVLTRVAA